MTDVFKLIEANGLTLHGDIEHFAELVRADEREAIAAEFEKRHEALKHRNNYWLHAANYVRARGNHD